MKLKKITALLLSCCFVAGISACKQDMNKSSDISKTPEIQKFTGFFASKQQEYNPNNALKDAITAKLGAECEETMLQDGDNVEDIVLEMISTEEYPDFIYAEKQNQKFVDAGAYIPIDEYWDGCDNLKRLLSDEYWNRIRAEDGHIYIIPIFSSVYMYDTNTIHEDEAFWMQVKVLKWAGYPKITTLDEYFDVIERYLEANPYDEDGSPNIGYEILTDGFYYFCLENPPQFLDGYPNDGCCMVDPQTLTAMDYNITDTAKRWFKKLNQEYHKGIVDPESFVLTRDQYFDKISSGHVLGMVDQRWNFAAAQTLLEDDEDQYVPIGVVIDKGITEHYHSDLALDGSEGLGISKSCKDIKGALKFVDSLLSPEIHTIRFWGLEGRNYEKGADGKFYLTESQRAQRASTDPMVNESSAYPLFPFFRGMDQDGVNAFSPTYQPSEFYEKLSDTMKECLSAYNAHTFVELLNKSEKSSAWYPMWSYSNTFTSDTAYGQAKEKMDSIKHEFLPKVVLSDDFESSWDEYMNVYKTQSNSQAYFDELTAEVRRRAGK